MPRLLTVVIAALAMAALSWALRAYPEHQGVLVMSSLLAVVGSCAGCRAGDEGGAS